jgi:hypothetical protein
MNLVFIAVITLISKPYILSHYIASSTKIKYGSVENIMGIVIASIYKESCHVLSIHLINKCVRVPSFTHFIMLQTGTYHRLFINRILSKILDWASTQGL